MIPEEGKVLRNGDEVHLTKTEFRLLCELAENPGQGVQPREPCSTRCGATTTSATAVWSTSTCAGCAPRSRPTRRTRATSSPCAGSATASRRDRARRPDLGRRVDTDPTGARSRRRAIGPPTGSDGGARALGLRRADPADLHARLVDAVAVPRRSPPTASPARAWSSSATATASTPPAARRHGAGAAGGNPPTPRARDRRARGLRRRARRSSGTSRHRVAASTRRTTSTTIPQVAPRPRDRTTSVPSRMTIDVGNEPTIVVGLPLPERQRLLRVLQPRRGQRHARQRPACRCCSARSSPPCFGVLLGVFAARRAVRPVRRRRPGGQGDRRWPARHAARTDRRPRPQRARQLVQRHGVGAADPHRARRPVRVATSATSCARR